MMKQIIALLLIISFSFSYSQNEEQLEHKLENVSWISGYWKDEAQGGKAEENWSKPTGGSMMAAYKLVKDRKELFYEIEII